MWRVNSAPTIGINTIPSIGCSGFARSKTPIPAAISASTVSSLFALKTGVVVIPSLAKVSFT
jgi:hypothetical protein